MKKHELRVTDCRRDVLHYFIDSGHALSTRELEETFGQYDRVTLYRTLNAFTEKGVIHSIPDSSGFARYGACHDTCGPGTHRHDHVHFKCEECGKIECIPSEQVPMVNLPGYTISESNLILAGTCEACNTLPQQSVSQ
ncbi:MAG: transcriptional repressor [Cyclobacteriaceae bacterium]|nr:transcriptional repressor [Cyclobacteriaceae bacterium]